MSRPVASAGPVERSIQTKLQAALSPVVLEITNDSSKHRHHAPMRAVGGGDGESHFTVEIVSDKFEGLRAIQRHRLVNDTLKEEFAAGLHALAIKAKSPFEYEAAGGALP
ncbi:Bol1p [Sporobolomyces koalae]|uniref:Bol1p n=1 Tax=Sporobolomyces koalae TaxID=500713 RepID=UPI00316D59C4